MKSNREVGTEYEAIAADYLQKIGYVILERNYKNKMGEIDLIARDGSDLVFIEVNTERIFRKEIQQKR